VTDAIVTELSAEVWLSADPNAFLIDTEDAVEVWITSDRNPWYQVTQNEFEIWATSDRNPRYEVTTKTVEVWIGELLSVTLPIYPTPPGLSYSVFWNPYFATLPTQQAANKAEIDILLADEPIHEFELTYDFLRNTTTWAGEGLALNEFKNFMGFFLRVKANAGRFLFWHPDDNRTLAEPVGTTDGSETDYGPLNRTFGVGDNIGVETVGYVHDTDLGTYPINVYFDGVLQSSGIYTIDKTFPKRQMLSFLIPPTGGQVITIDYSYYYYVKFAEDNLSFEKFMNTLWTIKRVTLRSLRYGT